jgi:antiviral helicase SLH1
MSPATLDLAQAEWQTQLATMRAALAELKLPPSYTNGKGAGYKLDFDFDEDDDFTSGNSGDDVWDFISDSEDDLYSSDFNETSPEASSSGYGLIWLKNKCMDIAMRRQNISWEELHEQILALLVSGSVDEELQSTLTDFLGFDDLEFVIELLSHRKEIIATPSVSVAKNDEGLFGKLQTKRQREEALRQRDYEHKNAALGPNLDRDGPQYPHVYKTHSAGNTLDSKGRKYAVPMGTERKERQVCWLLCQCNSYHSF